MRLLYSLIYLIYVLQVAAAVNCNNDTECGDSAFCSQGVCRGFGSCDSLLDCLNPANEYTLIYNDSTCTGPVACDEEIGRCVASCNDDECSTTTCSVSDPCQVASCLNEYDPAVSCTNYFCDGNCEAVFFNEIGDQVCTGTTACASDQDCDLYEYCAKGTCRTVERCGDDADCQNPANSNDGFAFVVDCIHYRQCTSGWCEHVCADTACADGSEPVTCEFEPCAVATCDEDYVSCFNDYCGECRAHFFNASGSKVCHAASQVAKTYYQPGDDGHDDDDDCPCLNKETVASWFLCRVAQMFSSC